jgi:ribosomal protein S6E (S10)
MKKVIRLNEEDITNLVNRVITELSPSIKNRSALAANKYKDETGSFAARRRSQKDSFLELPNSLNIMADNIARKMEQYFDGLTLRLRFNHELVKVSKIECSLEKNIESNSNIALLLKYRIKLMVMKEVPIAGEKRTEDITTPIKSDTQSFNIHQYYAINEDGNIKDQEQSFFDTLTLKLTRGYDHQSFQMTEEHNGITARDITQMLIRLHKKLKTEVSI